MDCSDAGVEWSTIHNVCMTIDRAGGYSQGGHKNMTNIMFW